MRWMHLTILAYLVGTWEHHVEIRQNLKPGYLTTSAAQETLAVVYLWWRLLWARFARESRNPYSSLVHPRSMASQIAQKTTHVFWNRGEAKQFGRGTNRRPTLLQRLEVFRVFFFLIFLRLPGFKTDFRFNTDRFGPSCWSWCFGDSTVGCHLRSEKIGTWKPHHTLVENPTLSTKKCCDGVQSFLANPSKFLGVLCFDRPFWCLIFDSIGARKPITYVLWLQKSICLCFFQVDFPKHLKPCVIYHACYTKMILQFL